MGREVGRLTLRDREDNGTDLFSLFTLAAGNLRAKARTPIRTYWPVHFWSAFLLVIRLQWSFLFLLAWKLLCVRTSLIFARSYPYADVSLQRTEGLSKSYMAGTERTQPTHLAPQIPHGPQVPGSDPFFPLISPSSKDTASDAQNVGWMLSLEGGHMDSPSEGIFDSWTWSPKGCLAPGLHSGRAKSQERVGGRS